MPRNERNIWRMTYTYTFFFFWLLSFIQDLPNFLFTSNGEKDNKINELQISKLNVFELVTATKISSNITATVP